jgi:hypothetical protein
MMTLGLVMNDIGATLFIILAIVFALFILWARQPSTKGQYGEYLVNKQLEALAKRFQGFSYHNLMFGEGDYSTQLDNLLITAKAVYVIEVKNYTGRVYGDVYRDQWYQTIVYLNQRRGRYGRRYQKTHVEKHSFFNPIKQNQIHINALLRNIPIIKLLPIFNLVIFTNQTDLTHLDIQEKMIYVMNRDKLDRFIEEIESTMKANPIDLMRIDQEIKAKNSYSEKNLIDHINKINNKYKK